MQKRLGLLGLLATVFLLPSAGFAQQQAVRWEATLDNAQRLAGQTNRLVLIQFWAPWCGNCKRMEAEVLIESRVVAEITADYVAVKIDADHFPATARQYGVTALPTTVIVTPQGQRVESMQGRMEATEYVVRLSQIAASVKQRGAVYAQMPTGTAPAAVAPAPTQTAVAAPAPTQALPNASPPPMAITSPSMPAGPDFSGRMPPPTAAASQPQVGSPGLSDGRYGNTLPGGLATPVTPIAQPPLAAAPPMGQSPALVASAPAYGSQLPLPSGPQQMGYSPSGSPPPGSPPGPPAGASPTPQLPAINPPLGLDGYCPVSLADRQPPQWVVGDRRWGAIHRGRTYLFAGPEEQRRFFADPDRYAPAASGNDVVLATERGQAVPGMRQHGVFYPERLPNHVYLFSSEATLEKFAKNPSLYANQALGAVRPGDYGGQQVR